MKNPKKDLDHQEGETPEVSSTSQSRRSFLGSTLGLTSATVLAGSVGSGLLAPAAQATDFYPEDSDRSLNGRNRAKVAAQLKRRAARRQQNRTLDMEAQLDNNDERRYSEERYYASFYKTLPQNEYGEVDRAAFRKLRRAMRTGKKRDFEAISLSDQAARKLANPQGAFRFEMTGLDSHATRMPPAPSFRSAKTAAEMGEVYWQALTRDVPFIDYENSPLIDDAVADLNNFSAPVGPKENGGVTPQTLFRGETSGDLNGPYISQFLLKDIPYGPSTIVQRYQLGVAGQDFMIDPANWINVQRGGAPSESLEFEETNRYIFNNRALSEYVHRDVLFQAYFNAALMILPMGPDAVDPDNPYLSSGNQGSFTSLGGPWLLQMLTYASNLALSGAWFQKWRVHRRLRPEAFGGRIHYHMTGERNYEIHSDILDSDAIAAVSSQNGTFFLPQAYTEGSPTHPAYPAGHATVAGACCTVLKAFFNEDFMLSDPVQADATGEQLVAYEGGDLRLGDEINKLANNVSIGRDAAGVHYRSDGVDGLAVGEQQAITLLREHIQLLNEDFPGLTLTKFNGETITIRKR